MVLSLIGKGAKASKAAAKRNKLAREKRAAAKRAKAKLVAAEKKKQERREDLKERMRKKSKRVAVQSPVAKSKSDVEGGTLDSETGRSFNVASDVGTGGEEVSRGAGTRAMSVLKEQQTEGSRARAKLIVKLEDKKRDRIITKAEQELLDDMTAKDKAAKTAQAGRSIKSRQTKSDAQRKRRAKEVDKVQHFLNTGEELEGFTATEQQIATAIRGLNARKQTAKTREALARIELSHPAVRGLSRSRTGITGRPAGSRDEPIIGVDKEQAKGVKPYQSKLDRDVVDLIGEKRKRVPFRGELNVGGLNITRAIKKGQKLTQAQLVKLTPQQLAAYQKKRAELQRAKQIAKRKSYTEKTPVIRGQTMSAARGGLMKNVHTDFRTGGLFRKQGK